jgi:hypothetical protein
MSCGGKIEITLGKIRIITAKGVNTGSHSLGKGSFETDMIVSAAAAIDVNPDIICLNFTIGDRRFGSSQNPDAGKIDIIKLGIINRNVFVSLHSVKGVIDSTIFQV